MARAPHRPDGVAASRMPMRRGSAAVRGGKRKARRRYHGRIHRTQRRVGRGSLIYAHRIYRIVGDRHFQQFHARIACDMDPCVAVLSLRLKPYETQTGRATAYVGRTRYRTCRCCCFAWLAVEGEDALDLTATRALELCLELLVDGLARMLLRRHRAR